MNWLSSFIAKVSAYFRQPGVQAAFNAVAKIVIIAQPIVVALAGLTPNRTVAEIVKAYQTYGVPLSQSITEDRTSTGNALFNLASVIVAQQVTHPVDTNIINSAVSLAVTAMKAGVKAGA